MTTPSSRPATADRYYRPTRTRARLSVAGLFVAAGLAGCGGGDDSASATTDAMPVTASVSADQPEITTPTTTAPAPPSTAPDTTTVVTSTPAATTESAATETQPSGRAESETWVDQDEVMSIEFNPAWQEVEDVSWEGTGWIVSEAIDGSQGALTITFNALLVEPDSWIDEMIEGVSDVEADDFRLIDSGSMTGTNGQELYFIEYERTPDGRDHVRHYRQVLAPGTLSTVIATLVMPAGRWDEESPPVLPYLETVQNLV